jgi:hypothetical protein
MNVNEPIPDGHRYRTAFRNREYVLTAAEVQRVRGLSRALVEA